MRDDINYSNFQMRIVHQELGCPFLLFFFLKDFFFVPFIPCTGASAMLLFNWPTDPKKKKWRLNQGKTTMSYHFFGSHLFSSRETRDAKWGRDGNQGICGNFDILKTSENLAILRIDLGQKNEVWLKYAWRTTLPLTNCFIQYFWW